MMTEIKEYLIKIKNELENGNKGIKKKKIKTILDECGGYSRRSKVFVDTFNLILDEIGLITDQRLDMYLPYNSYLTFTTKTSDQDKTNETTSSQPIHNKAEIDILKVYNDFLYYLFDFGSEQEYEMFQACLDTNKPVAIFLIPEKDDFFSDVIEKVLVYELIRKRQYKGLHSNESTEINTHSSEFHSLLPASAETGELNGTNGWSKSNILHFNRKMMSNVLFGNTGYELIESEKFDDQFNQLAIYSNKYLSKQFFLLFHCPSKRDIDLNQREDILGRLVDKISGKFPFVFTLRCKYSSDRDIDNETRRKIVQHFSILLELPYYSIDEEMSILDMFIEMQKAQVQSESQLILKMNHEYWKSLNWGFESDEHIYLKYFAIKTLESKGYSLSEIKCEQEVYSEENEDSKRRPDVYVKDKVIVEVETLRGKSNGDNVYLDLIKNILYKIDGWQSKLEELWLVLPGVEVARHHHKLKKSEEIIYAKLRKKYGDPVKLMIMTPDYQNHQLIPVSFEKLNYPSFNITRSSRIETKKEYQQIEIHNKIDFTHIKGLNEEKDKLNKLMELNKKGFNSGIGGIIFYGLPGCGKTLLAQAFANESGRFFLQFSPADIQSSWIGQSQKNIKDIFSQAKFKSPSILFIDELESIAFSRSEQHAHTDQKSTINQLLIELNNIRNHDVIVIGATNMLGKIDSAFKRSGRFDWKIPIFPPNPNERAELFGYYLTKIQSEINNKLSLNIKLDEIDFVQLGSESVGFNSSDIELLCNEVRQLILLEEMETMLKTRSIVDLIKSFTAQGLSLTKENVNEFIQECEYLNIKSPKINFLKEEWDLL